MVLWCAGRLGNQHAVNRIPVVARQAPGDQRVRDRDGQSLEAMPSSLLQALGWLHLGVRRPPILPGSVLLDVG